MKGKTVLQNMSAYKQGMQIKEVKDKYQLDRIVKLASNENPYGCSPKVKEVLMQFQNEIEIYPDGYALNLRDKDAKKHQVTNDQNVLGAGSDEIVAVICRAFLEKGTNTVMAEHTFPQYKHHALIEGAEVVEVPTKAGYHHLDNMMSRIDDQTKVVWICAPDNPTGTLNQR